MEEFKTFGGIKTNYLQKVHVTNDDKKLYPIIVTFDGSDNSFERILQNVSCKEIIVNIEIDQFSIKTIKGFETVIPGDKVIIFNKQTVQLIKHD